MLVREEKVVEVVTTGLGGFAVCLGHTTKPKSLTAKALPCVAHGEEHTANSPTVNFNFAHGEIAGTRRSFAVSQH
jgi:hypothetical protein